jgi:hypothetical protein
MNVSTLAAAAKAAKPAPIPQPPGRYLLCDPAKGSMNVQDTHVAAEIAAGGTFASWVDGKDKNGNYIGLTCDPGRPGPVLNSAGPGPWCHRLARIPENFGGDVPEVLHDLGARGPVGSNPCR